MMAPRIGGHFYSQPFKIPVNIEYFIKQRIRFGGSIFSIFKNELSRLYADKNGLLIQMTHAGFSNPKLSKDLDDIIRREAYLLSKEEELSKTLGSEKYPPNDERKQVQTPKQPVNPPMGVDQIEHTMEHPENNVPDIDANPELFDFEIEEDIDIHNDEQQALLDEFDDLREDTDRDEHDMDYDEDELER